MKSFVLLLPLLFALAACAPKRSKQSPPAPVAPQSTPAPTPAPTACEIAQSYLNENTANRVANEETIHIERHYQRVVRKDCSGAVTSDQVETVRSPTGNIELKPPTQDRFVAVFAFNESSCDHRLTAMPIAWYLSLSNLYSVYGNGKSKITLQGDLSGGHFNFRLRKGLNKIFIQYFYDCQPKDVPGNKNVIVGVGTCEKSKNSLIAYYPVQVTYDEKHLNGIKEVRATDCDSKSGRKKD